MIRRAYFIVAWSLVVVATAGILLLWFATPSGASEFPPTQTLRGVPQADGRSEAIEADMASGVVSPAAPQLSGTATWYRWHRGEAAAGPLLRRELGRGWRGQTVTVCSSGQCTTVRLTDWCACHSGRRLVDLDARSFARLAPLSRGVIRVTVSRVGVERTGQAPTAPPTDLDS